MQSLTHALFHLLANPDIIPALREDIEEIVCREGWTKAALDKMWKLDSLLRESQRFTGITVLGMLRRAMKGITLADGTYLPEGCLFAFAGQATHSDSRNYDRSEQFEPFRFSDLREAGESARYQFVNTSSEYMPFGRGKHAWCALPDVWRKQDPLADEWFQFSPGRFFASMELKVVLAYLILHYDMKFEGETAGRPANFNLSFSVIPSQDAVIQFKRRYRS
uniref:Cytochrome P450 51 n=1 Tax=Ganoderma boninense TaxID=34458 RepID=A0A5K1JXZ3_9APHY|nr:Cytochrome P450 51 [Ganoderma boninense]